MENGEWGKSRSQSPRHCSNIGQSNSTSEKLKRPASRIESVEPVYRQLVDLLLRSKELSKDNLIQARNVIEALQLAELETSFETPVPSPKR